MKPQGYLFILLLLASSFAGNELRAADRESLRYKFTESTTNAYRVSIELPSQNMPMRFEGTVLVGVRNVDEDVATVFFRGRIQAKPVEAGGRFAAPGQLRPNGPFGPGFEPWRFTYLNPFNEAQVDSSGRILRTQGLQELPKPFETYAQILFHQLPTDLAKPSETEEPFTSDEDGSIGQGGFHPGRPGSAPGRISGRRKETIQAEKSDATVKLQKSVEFQSYLKTDDEPRLSFKTKSELLCDSATGMLKSAKIEGTAVTVTPDVSQKISVTVQIEQLEGAELARAIDEIAEPSATISDAELDKLVRQLQGDDQPKRVEAAQRLLSVDITRHATTLLPVVVPFLNENDPLIRPMVVRVLARAATREHLPLLYQMLKQEDTGYNHEIIGALGRLSDKSSIQMLADMITYGTGYSHSAAEALGEFGSVAEDVALGLLKEKHLETRRIACQILRKVGTQKGIEALQAIIAAGDPQLIQEATETVQNIRQREEETAKLVF